MNECETDGVCSPYATCDNYPGSFNCTCNSGYRGDGFTCYGEFSLYAQGDSDVISFRIYMPAGFSPPYFRSRYTFSLFGLCAFSVCNVALNRPSFQSSTYVYQQVSYGARLGILGTTPEHRRYHTVNALVLKVLHTTRVHGL